MSFGKAKIRRFNDVQSDTPAPGTYNPTVPHKIKGYAPQKSKRFYEDKTITKIVASNSKTKQLQTKNYKPIMKSTTTAKSKIHQPVSGAARVNEITDHINVLEFEMKNLKIKISKNMPSMNNKVVDLHEIWQEKKQSLISGDKEAGRLIDDNLNNILKEMSHLLNVSQEGRFQEIAFIQAMNT